MPTAPEKIEFNDAMLEQITAAFKPLAAKAQVLEVATLAPIVVALLKQLGLPDSDASAAFERMQKPRGTEPWSTMKRRGAFIVFEGLDRAGKSTQSKELLAHLQKKAVQEEDDAVSKRQKCLGVKWMCFPARHTPLGSLIDLYLRNKVELPDRAVHLLFSANRWEIANTIKADLEAGYTVVCDRYAFSGVVYSCAKGVEGMDAAWCRTPDVGLPRPDLVFFLHLDPAEGAKRAAFGDERYENTNMQAAVREQFAAANFGEQVSWNAVDGGQEKAVITEEIRGTVTKFFAEAAENDMAPLAALWV
jgi:dTMP kinase